MHVAWEENVFAALEDLDEEGQERVSHLAAASLADERPVEPMNLEADLPALEELQLEVQPPRLA